MQFVGFRIQLKTLKRFNVGTWLLGANTTVITWPKSPDCPHWAQWHGYSVHVSTPVGWQGVWRDVTALVHGPVTGLEMFSPAGTLLQVKDDRNMEMWSLQGTIWCDSMSLQLAASGEQGNYKWECQCYVTNVKFRSDKIGRNETVYFLDMCSKPDKGLPRDWQSGKLKILIHWDKYETYYLT